jgi:hypothetical protein
MMRLTACFLLLAATTFQASAANEIPPSFRGNWARNPAECNPNHPAYEALMVVAPRQFRGYEYGCRIGRVQAESATSFRAVAACEGEGQKYQSNVNWTLLDGGRRLSDGSDTRVRCPGR